MAKINPGSARRLNSASRPGRSCMRGRNLEPDARAVVPHLTLTDPVTGRTLQVWDGRITMRTLDDALVKLLDLKGLAPDERAVIRTGPMHLPNGEFSAVVIVTAAQR